MSIEPKRSVLRDLRKPLIEPTANIPVGLEERLLGRDAEGARVGVGPSPTDLEVTSSRAGYNGGRGSRRNGKDRVPTIAVTFHLPVDLRDRVKVTAQAKQKTMLEIAIEALTEYLDKYPVIEADLRRMLGL